MKKLVYPGRGIVIGIDFIKQYLVQIYWLMGRSENSRNRVLKCDSFGKVWTEAADPEKVKDPSLIIYTAMKQKAGLYVVSNGCQTDSVIKWGLPIRKFGHFRKTMFQFNYEPDVNFTPRISAVCSLRNIGSTPSMAEMAIITKSNRNLDCDRHFYSFNEFEPGTGYCITTYEGNDENPLPAFNGPPYKVKLGGDIYDVRQRFWNDLNPENRISLAVKFIDLKTRAFDVKIMNKYEQVES